MVPIVCREKAVHETLAAYIILLQLPAAAAAADAAAD